MYCEAKKNSEPSEYLDFFFFEIYLTDTLAKIAEIVSTTLKAQLAKKTSNSTKSIYLVPDIHIFIFLKEW